jgi:hypothetical protein
MVKSNDSAEQFIFARLRGPTGARLNRWKAYLQMADGMNKSSDRAINALLDIAAETKGVEL